MRRLGIYLHTLRYLTPIQICGRIYHYLPRPAVPTDRLPAVRRYDTLWRQSPLRQTSLLAPARFRFLNEEGEVRCAGDWNDPQRGKLWLYHLHYFDDLVAEGAAERAAWHKTLIQRWITENPPGCGNGWEPYPLARRIINWTKWVWQGNDLPAGAADSLALQTRWLRRRLEWHLLGNHLLADAKGLIFAGLFFEGREANGWLTKGGTIFVQQLTEQILADGGHFERSPMYHAQVLEDVLDVANALRAHSGCDFAGREKILEQSSTTAARMLAWLQVLQHPDGQIALFNDAAWGITPHPSELRAYAERLDIVEEMAGITEAELEESPLGSRFRGNDKRDTGKETEAKIEINREDKKEDGQNGGTNNVVFTYLKDTGYIRVDNGEAVAFLDVAPIGPDYLPGHAHADTLSFELSFGTQRAIVDSGVSCYGDGPERLRQRGTAAHNTVVIDGQDSSEVWGSFRVARRAYPRNLRILESMGVVSCSHDGYRRLPGRPIHRREWRFREGGLQIRDTIEGTFRNAVEHLHFHPDVRVVSSPNSRDRGMATCPSGKLLLADGREIRWKLGRGSSRILDTTWHPEFGASLPNQCLELQFTDREIEIDFEWSVTPRAENQ